MESVLVTGANGFLGAALSERLTNMGCRVVGLVRDRNYKSRRSILDKISVVHGDLRDFDTVRYAMSHYEIDTVFHLAAVTILRKSVVDPLTCYQTNVMGTVNVLEAARQVGIKKVVKASSDKAYGTYEELPYVETMAVQASADAYSTSKACSDLVAQQYAKGYGLDLSIVRAGNIYGPGDLNLSRLIPKSILRCFDGKQPTLYKGVAQYKREFMYIDDVVDAYILLAERGLLGEAYNVGGSGFQSILKTVNKIIKLTGANVKPKIIEKDFIEIKEQYLDSTKIEDLGWTCKFDINSGLHETVEWYKEWQSKVAFFDGNSHM
jgi:CDP-glucose 4,6-dehydratase